MRGPRRFSSNAHFGVGSILLIGMVVMTIGCNQQPSQQPPGTTQSGGPAPAATTHGATFVDQTVPPQMMADGSYTVSIQMRNTGAAAWTPTENYRIGTLNPIDNEVWGFKRVAVPGMVAPGTEATFKFALKAPRTPGEYNFQWRMVQDGIEWFGEETPNVLVTVAGQLSKETR
jgi:hypothetical protein